jgi:hypothetical protein
MGIPNKMFYLLANGGTHNNVTVTGIGIQNAMAIMYRANRDYWDSAASYTFVETAVGCILAAFDTNYISIWPQQTSKAWDAVDVCDTMPGDANGTPPVGLPDVVHLINYVFDKDRPGIGCYGIDPGNCWTPTPLCRGEVTGVEPVNLQDVIWLVNFVFDKDRPLLSCLGAGSIPCWLPIPNDVCCKLP